MGNEKEVDPLSLSLTQRAQSYISAIDFFTPVLNRSQTQTLNFSGYICSAVFSVDEYFFFADDRSSEVALSRPLGIKFLRLLMCYAAAIGAGNIKQS